MWKFLEGFKNIQCIYIDLPGHGASELDPTLELSMASIAISIKALVGEMGIESYDVVGHSMGGYVALELKKLNSHCDNVVLLNSNFWEDGKDKKMDRRRVAELVQTKKETFVQTAIPNLFMNPDKRSFEVDELIEEASLISSETIALSSLAMSKRVDSTSLIKENADSVLIIQGKHDSIVQCDIMEERVKGAEVSVIKLDCGHMAHIESSSAVKEAIEKFVAKKTEIVSFRYH
ncbi:MAG: alpha/beta hydrolase [Crocinitomicaceae bacterium]|nr:alpha/beta hydrolase [Crocinitomicaceae bacterium]